ncbi:MAG: carbamoyltransferase HypF, partial [Acidobacteriota bacterium]
RGRPRAEIARAFHLGVAQGLCDAVRALGEQHAAGTVVCSGGVFQNDLLGAAVRDGLTADRLAVWSNQCVPCNDGGISLGQAALAVCGPAPRRLDTLKGDA